MLMPYILVIKLHTFEIDKSTSRAMSSEKAIKPNEGDEEEEYEINAILDERIGPDNSVSFVIFILF